MGQQQLLLIILGVIIVGIAVAVGITMFIGGARDANRDQIINDLVNFGAKAQQYYRRPIAMGGGGNSFIGYGLSIAEKINANGNYKVTNTASDTTGPAAIVGDTVTWAGAVTGPLVIVGSGVETGNNATNPVKAFIRVSPATSSARSLN